MEHENNEWHLKKIFCPNCRNMIVGIEDKDGIARVTCNHCRAIIVSRTMGRRHERIDVYAPKGEQRIG